MSTSATQQNGRILVLGVDSGGTKSEALLADSGGNVLGHGLCDFRDPDSGRGPEGSGRTRQTVLRAVKQALQGLGDEPVATVYVAGRGALPNGWASESLLSVARFFPVSEPAAWLALAGARAGVVVLSGTGAFVYGRTDDGRETFLDALGPLLGDAGSAFEIGLRAVRCVARAGWHPRHRTSMTEPIIEACRAYAGKEGRFSLVSFMLQCRDRSELASLARIVDEHAERGDGIARQVLQQAADSISETLRDVVENLGLSKAELPLIAAGSVARLSQTYWARVCENASRLAPRLRPVVPQHREVVGVMLAARPRMEGLSPCFAKALLAQSLHFDGGVS